MGRDGVTIIALRGQVSPGTMDVVSAPLRLDLVSSCADPRAVVLFLHGGQERSTEPVRDRHASWWRVLLLARSLRGFAAAERLELRLLQFRHRGWNGPTDPSPVVDAREALATLAAERPGVPVVLVGHSMGGRTACRVADDPGVVGVVALAPWLPEGEPNATLAGKDLHVLHGSIDQWTSPHWSRVFVERTRQIARTATWTSLPGAGHFMFRRVRDWRTFVEDSVRAILQIPADPPATAEEAHDRPHR